MKIGFATFGAEIVSAFAYLHSVRFIILIFCYNCIFFYNCKFFYSAKNAARFRSRQLAIAFFQAQLAI